ncbi:MAG: hypothetical protein A2Z74_02680 [Chloroflexi bacterium RBG_13_46_9]|nr:MAG: hypothetical protein A2Z74_02680 [Chloroflexi bacterium RBG_13_46_9]
MPSPQLRVFISYPTSDGLDKARQAANLLKQVGLQVWIWHHSKTAGALTWREISNCIVNESDLVLYICTASSCQSWGQGQEAGYALNHRRKVIVVAIDAAMVPLELTARCYERVPSAQFVEKLRGIAINLPEITNRIQKLDDSVAATDLR